MKPIRRLIAPLTLTLATSALAADVTVTITDISEPTGMIHWALYDNAEAFDNGGMPVLAGRSRVSGERLQTTVHDLAPGRYAVRLYHDADGNGEMNTNLLGIPTEGYGFSNGAGNFGPADFDDAAVAVEGDTVIEVNVR